MKTLYLVRHAKSSWKNIEIPDHERPLLEKGKKRTRKIIEYLQTKDVNINYMVSSPAIRAYETSKFIAGAFAYPVEKIRMSPLLYYGNDELILDLVQNIPNNYNSVMIVGHNPSITNLVNRFIDPQLDYLPTSGIVNLGFDTNYWCDINTVRIFLNFIIYPKLLGEENSEQWFETSFSYEMI